MKTLMVLVVLAGLAWYGYGKFKAAAHPASEAAPSPVGYASEWQPGAAEADAPFQCDGRTRCPQMTSCAEATWFVRHCPNTKMDGNHDGVPCERQWCN